jgi:hypothetical protein
MLEIGLTKESKGQKLTKLIQTYAILICRHGVLYFI